MTNVGPAPIVTPPPGSSHSSHGQSFVEWGAVIAGAFLAAAISFVLLSFGTAIGLSATSPWPNSGVSAKVVASIAVFWVFAQQIGAFMAGGYVAGRMRSRWHEPTEHEVEFRDGLHGGLVWGVGVVMGAALLLSAAGNVAEKATQTAGQAASTAAASTNDPMGAILDTMARPTSAQAGATGPAAAPTPGNRRTQGGDDTREEMSRILASAVANGSLSGADRTYLAQLVAQRAGIPQADAEKRVDDALNAARAAADKARRAAVLTGFVTAASLILSLGAAWWAALKGGQHRDNSVPARFDFAHNRRQPTPVR
jgi:hypothetical protein